MSSINFPENRISERVRKTLDEYHDEIMRGWNDEMRETELPPFLPHDTGEIMIIEGVGEIEPELECYVPFKGMDQLDIDNPECVNHALYRTLHRFKRQKCNGSLEEQELVDTFNIAYACTLDALNHSHPETHYYEYFEKYHYYHADVEVIKAFVYVLLSEEKHRFTHTGLLLEDLEYSDKNGTIEYFAKALGVPFATDLNDDDEEQNEGDSAQEKEPQHKTRPMIFKNKATTQYWAKVVNETLANTLESRFVSKKFEPQLAAIIYFDYWWSSRQVYKKGRLPSASALLDFFITYCEFTANLNQDNQYKTALNGILDNVMRKDGVPEINDEIKNKYRDLWDKIKKAVIKSKQ